MRLVRVTILYKNGARVRLRCKSFTVAHSRLDGSVQRLEWEDAYPRPLMAGIDEVAAVFSRKWSLLRVIAAVLAVAIVGMVLASPAFAAESTVDICRHADGTPAATDGWQPAVTDDSPGNIVANSCAQGGHIDLALGAGTHGKAGGSASVLLAGTLPPGATWTRLQAWLAYTSSPVTAAEDPAHSVGLMVAGTSPCSWGRGGAGCSLFGSFSAAPLADVNRLTVTPTAPGQLLAIGVVCDSSPAMCPATSGEPYAKVRIWRIAVTMQTPDPPTMPATHDPGAPALAPGGAAAVGKLTVRLHRHGSRRVRLSGRLVGADGKPVARARLVLRRQAKGRKAMFSRVVTRRDGSFSRVLARGLRTVRVTVRYGALSRTVRIGARR